MGYLVAIISALTGFLFGFDEGIISGLLEDIKNDFALTELQIGVMMGLLPFGALLSASMTGYFADKIGRLRVLLSVPIIFSIGTLAICSDGSFLLLLVARLFLGMSIGVSVVISPLYIAETAPKEIRGKLLTYFQLAITLGILFAYLINLANSSLLSPYSWRLVFATGLLPSTLLFVGALFLPESPRWLILRGRDREAEASLKRLSFHSSAAFELHEIEEVVQHEKNEGFIKTLFSKKFGPIFLMGVLLFFFQQLSGINVIIYYAPTIFSQLQFESQMVSLMATVGIGLINMLATFIAIHYIETTGRRTLLLRGFFGTAASLFFIAGATYLEIPFLPWISVVALLLYIVSFAFSVGPLPWVMMPEIFPLNIRGEGASLSAASNWVFNTLVVTTFPLLMTNYGISLSLTLYACFCTMGFLFVWYFLPETKGLSLEKIEEHIQSGKPLRLLGR